jgi:hypothetical protein
MPKHSTNNAWLTTDQVNASIEKLVGEHNESQSDARKHALAVPCAESYDQLIRFVNERDIQELTAIDQGKIIVPFLKNLNHYVLLVVDQDLRTITYMDPLGHAMPTSLDDTIKQREWLFNDFGVIDEKNTQQQNSYDCGIFAILNAQQRLFDTPMPDQAMATEYRNTRPELSDDPQVSSSVAGEKTPSSSKDIMATLMAYANVTKKPAEALNVLTGVDSSGSALPPVSPEYSLFAGSRGPLYASALRAQNDFLAMTTEQQVSVRTAANSRLKTISVNAAQQLKNTKHLTLNRMLDSNCGQEAFENAFDEATLEVARMDALLDAKQRHSPSAAPCASEQH